ncbi:MAG: hypothetical protein WBL27_07610 [Salinimicrobium sp.]
MKNVIFACLLFFSFNAFAQKEVSKVLDAGNLNKIVLSSDEIFRITIETAPVHSISIKSQADGEYFNDISLDSEVKGKTLFLKSLFPEALQDGFDKLSAHKVFAMEIKMQIPEDMNVEINSNLASVFLEGEYENVLVQLKQGSFYSEEFSGNAVINTYDGNIEMTTSNALVDAETRHGTVKIPHAARGTHKIKLTSINGDIEVSETK